MEATLSNPTVTSRPRTLSFWVGTGLSTLAVLFLSFDAVIKLIQIAPVVATFAKLGVPISLAPVLGAIELACLALYLIPRSALVGAVLWTGYLGGAIATHARIGSPLLGFTLFPVYVAVLLWGGLYLRDARVRALLQPNE